MAFNRPTLSQIVSRIKGDILDGLQLPAILRRSFEDVSAKALGGASHTLHGHIDYAIFKKFFPDSGDDATVIRWSTLFDVPRKEATFTKLNIDIVFDGAATLPAGTTIFQRSDGFQYTLDAEVTATVAGTLPGIVTASTNPNNIETAAGADGNMADGEKISLLSPVANVQTEATVTSTNVEGEEQESIEDLRTRVLNRIQNPPAGGTAADYITFALSVAGITRAWVLPGGIGVRRGEVTVDVTGVEDGNFPASIIPSVAKVQEMQDVMDLKAPLPADVLAFAPTDDSVDFDIQLKPNTQEVRDAVTAELQDLVFREAQVRGAYAGVGLTYDGKIPLSKINEAISIASGETDHVLTSPATDPQASEGGLLTVGAINFSTLV